ncbi:MAG: uroporphyrinogen decarboxylase [Deltaproteobacteria bacterium]|nr:uroporphyrinogen decarboxylase [Deltaproteobacteria bacterium]
MKERFVELAAEAEKKQDERFQIWLQGEGIPFVDGEAEAAYKARVTLLKDAIQLRKTPKRIPVCPSAGFFPMEYARITMFDAMYDYRALSRAWDSYHQAFQPDAYNSPTTIVPGRVLDILDLKIYQWPGHGLSKEREYQYVEGEYMKAEDYQDLIDDPTAFFMNVYLPRVFGGLKPFSAFPLLPPINEIPLVPLMAMPFGSENMKAALDALSRAGEEALQWRAVVREIGMHIMGRGYPAFSGGFTKAPFDVIGDSLRGTKGVMLDMFRHQDELREACERLIPSMIKCAAAACGAGGHIMPFIPLHKGADGFMSQEQFRAFYWPSLRKLIIGLVNEGLVPQLFAEGSYNTRLDIISDVPKGKVVWWFDRTDMKRAKKTVGQGACVAGNVPLDLLCTGTPGEVRVYCKELIDVAGKGGGFILSSGAGIQGAKPENVKAMIDFAKEYGAHA